MNYKKKCGAIAATLPALFLTGCISAPQAQEKLAATTLYDINRVHNQILKYKTWKPVNPEPVKLNVLVGAACANAMKAISTPHADKFVRVYVNDVGLAPMLEAKSPQFPAGTIIVKEKLPNKTSNTPEFFTIMVKRETAYDPDNGDWQYLIMEPDMAKLEKPSDVENCQSCHATWAKTSDFVSRIYLSPEQNRKLK
ncbi:MAG TPA: hypothetical protein DC054_02000 [Blastocatellia bacterium]|nr:hypothetical protein [Blastocatellia bacterium]